MDISSFSSLDQLVETMQGYTKSAHPFSITFVKLDGSIAYIDKAAMGKRSSKGNSKHYIPIINLENKDRRKAFITSITAINSIKVILKR